MNTVERLIAKLDRVANDDRYPQAARDGARRDADGYRKALKAKAS